MYLRRPGHLLAHLVQRENQPVANLYAVWPLDPQTVCGVPVRADAMLLHCTSRPRCFSSPGGRRRTWMVSLLAVMSTPTNTGRSRSWPLLPWGPSANLRIKVSNPVSVRVGHMPVKPHREAGA